MKVLITVEEIFDKGLWSETCEMLGINPWAKNEGLIDNDEELEFTTEQAQELGLIPKEQADE